MALRVLLADESTTIKKVMQLALQDFAVEVKAVHVGIDVVEVARSFKPDVIFADILLQKKNGYEVSADLKREDGLKSIPVVLMWSSFMDLDEALAQQSGADGRLEKPFDVENLRQLILELVPKTRSQRLAHFLKYPDNITEPLKNESAPKPEGAVQEPPPRPTSGGESADTDKTSPALHPVASASPEPQVTTPPPLPPEARPPNESSPAPSKWSMDSFEDINKFAPSDTDEAAPPQSRESEPTDAGDEEFAQFKLTQLTQPEKHVRPASRQTAEDPPIEERDPWSHQDLSNFKLNLAPVSVDIDEHEVSFNISEQDFENTDFLYKPESSSAPSLPRDPTSVVERKLEEPVAIEPVGNIQNDRQQEAAIETLEMGSIPQLSAERLEEIVRSQSREIIESMVRRIVPDIASDLIKKELQRLLDETTAPERPRQENR